MTCLEVFTLGVAEKEAKETFRFGCIAKPLLNSSLCSATWIAAFGSEEVVKAGFDGLDCLSAEAAALHPDQVQPRKLVTAFENKEWCGIESGACAAAHHNTLADTGELVNKAVA